MLRRLGGLLLLAAVAFGQGAALELKPGTRPILQVQALHGDGKVRTLRMLLDTGAVDCVLDRRVAESLVVGPLKEVKIQGFGAGSRKAFRRVFRALTLAGRTRSQVPVVVADLAKSNRWLDAPLDGFLGMSFLGGCVFTLDPLVATFRWGAEVPNARWFPLEPHASDPRPYARLMGESRPLLLDTGAGGTLYGLDLPLDEGCEVAGGLTGVRAIGVGQRRIQVFGETFEGTRVHSGDGQLILGAVFLLGGPVAFDLDQQRLGLAQDPQGRLHRAPARSGEAFSPIVWNREGRASFLEVVELPPCNRWFRAGFREGDRVLGVEGLDGPLTLDRLNAKLLEGRPLRWTLERKGRAWTLTSPAEKEIQWFE